MRLRLLCLAPALLAGACSGGGGSSGEDTPTIADVTPDFGPLGGGKRVLVHGTGFLSAGAPPNRVVFGGREAIQAGVIDDETLEAIIPAQDSPGEVDVVVFNSNGLAMAEGVFRYSDPPAISSVSPADVRYDQPGTITISGSGFADEDAGQVTLLVDGVEMLEVDVVDDGTITFEAPAGVPTIAPDIEIVNGRGDVREDDAFRYVGGASGGLILMPNPQSATTLGIWAGYFDIATGDVVTIPKRNRGGGGGEGYRSIVRVAGEMHGQFRDDSWHHIDFEDQIATTGGGGGVPRYQALAAVGTTVYAIDRNTSQFGTVNVTTGAFTRVGTSNPCGSRCGLAANSAGTMFLVNNGSNITTINLTTGVAGTNVPLVGGFTHVTGMRFVGGTLYAATRDSAVVTINPATGIVTTVAVAPFQISDVEVFE